MSLDATTAEIRTWLVERDFPVATQGRIPAEFHDVWLASDQLLVPPGRNSIAYVNDVRKWIISQGTQLERMMYLSPYHFRKYNEAHHPESPGTYEVREEDVKHAPEVTDPVVPEPSAKERYSGKVLILHKMNEMFTSLVITALYEAMSALYETFSPFGEPDESSYERLADVAEILGGAQKFIRQLQGTFTAEAKAKASNPIPVSSIIPMTPGNDIADIIGRILADPSTPMSDIKPSLKENMPLPADVWEQTYQIRRDNRNPLQGKGVTHADKPLSGYIEAVGVDMDADTMYLIHWYDNDVVHEWCFPDEVVVLT